MTEFIWPLAKHVVTRDFYFKASLYVGGQHAALDIIDPSGTLGKPVLAVADGTAMANPLDYYSGLNAYVSHTDGWRSGYRHFSAHVLPLNVPTVVKQGDVIGYAGSTGLSTGPHLHFDLWNKAKLSPEAFYKLSWWAHDPLLYLGKEDDMTLTTAQEAKLDKILEVLWGDISPEPGLQSRLARIHERVENAMLSEAQVRAIIRDELDKKSLIQITGQSTWTLGPLGKRRLRTDTEVSVYLRAGWTVTEVTQAEADSIPDVGLSHYK